MKLEMAMSGDHDRVVLARHIHPPSAQHLGLDDAKKYKYQPNSLNGRSYITVLSSPYP